MQKVGLKLRRTAKSRISANLVVDRTQPCLHFPWPEASKAEPWKVQLQQPSCSSAGVGKGCDQQALQEPCTSLFTTIQLGNLIQTLWNQASQVTGCDHKGRDTWTEGMTCMHIPSVFHFITGL